METTRVSDDGDDESDHDNDGDEGAKTDLLAVIDEVEVHKLHAPALHAARRYRHVVDIVCRRQVVKLGHAR